MTISIEPRLGILGGMGPLATADFLQKLIAETPAARDEEHIPVIVYSVPQIPSRPQPSSAVGRRRCRQCSRACARSNPQALGSSRSRATPRTTGTTHS